ncbi:two component transcriptional regulator, AraC family [Clostridium amylolyticum]|uniref:Stage 0 sporulation protein A homolog n=1 Tax=Clostridium amylolyticum TaxID=1121298 RepID=A0A1M6F3G7_9CLOT|nr:response regulator [Clostridium amylolyticum]SHI92247.1 two component transcriptional regulator, AraC family [Clostridium amylolyticum]
MNNILLVDDEPWILSGLKSIIDWHNIGIDNIFTASNGEEALEAFNNSNINIVVTDITMPKMNGLELIKNIKAKNNKTKFVILSGYDDFNYAKQAISLGIENYILKPINEEELESTIANIIRKINMEITTQHIENTDLQTLKENIYLRWITDSISESELETREFVLNLSIHLDKYVVGMVKFKSATMDMIKRIKKFFKGTLPFKNSDVFIKDNQYLIIIAGCVKDSEGTNQINLLNYLEDSKNEILNTYGVETFISVGNSVNLPENLHKSYEEALTCSEYLLLLGYNNVVFYEDIASSFREASEGFEVELEEFERLLLQKNLKDINFYISNVFKSIRSSLKIKPKDIRNLSVRMILVLRKVSIELNVEDYNINKYLNDIILYIQQEETLDMLEIRIKEEARELTMKIENVEYTPVVQQILNYINDNYGEKHSLKILARKYNMNTSYLGQIFAKEVGCSFSDYINKVKNEKAKEMLLNTNMKVNDIAKSIGFDDTSYFYKKFKTYFGISPHEMRNSKKY